jgi:hypothetical protein
MNDFLKVLKGNLQFPNINIFNRNKTTNNIKFLCITNEGKLLILEDINTFNEIVKFYKNVEFHNSNLIFYNNLGKEVAAITLSNGVLDLLSNDVAKVNGANIITDINGITADANGSVTLNLNSAPRVVNSNTTAINDETIIIVADSTISNPSIPVEGKGYKVIIVNGIATINGINYGEGRIITRFFHSGSWRTKVYVDETIIGSAVQTALNNKQNTLGYTPENVINKTNLITSGIGTYPNTPTVKNYVDLDESSFGVKNRYVSVLSIQSTITTSNLGSSAANTNNRVTFIPFRVGKDINIKNIAILQNAENNGANSNLTFYIYNDSNDGLPGIKLHQVISSNGIFIGATKVIDLLTNFNLVRGNYWIGIHLRSLNTVGTNPTFVGGNVTWNSVLEDTLIYSNNRNNVLVVANQSTDLGNNPILSNSLSATISLPQIFIKL